MKKQLRFFGFIFTVFFLALPWQIRASHIMGGNLSYTYSGYNAGTNKHIFDVTLKMYRYCAPGSSNLPNSLDLGVYDEDPANPGADKVRNSTFTLPLIENSFITPPNANDSCTFLPNVCVEEGIYSFTIGLDPSIGGYHLIVDRCCRNANIGNLLNPGDAGQAYYAFIPPTSIPNSSPVFGLAPVPFICANDTVTYSNTAFDPDGDSLVYSFETPYNGLSNTTQPAPVPPFTYPWTIPTIAYAPGFSVGSPFGATGYASIDPSTGLTIYLSQNVAFYVVAVEVKEYRNGSLIGITRRDLQLIFITCPANPPPNIAAVTQPHLQDTIVEGQTICFPITYTDPNGDSLFLTATGNIFNGAIINPPATLSNSSGLGTVTSQFCWTTSCSQGSLTPYQFNVGVTDNGCPAKTTNSAFSILVLPYTTPAITGTDTICGNAITGLAYSAPGGMNGSTYNWIITNGTQVSGGNTNSITVNWNGGVNGTVSVVATSPDGCVGDTSTKTVVIKPIPTANAGNNVTFCSGSGAPIGTGSTPGYTYSWSPATGLSNTTISNPNVTLTNTGLTPVTSNYIVTVSNSGCTNKDTVQVTVNPAAVANAGGDQSLCNGPTINLGTGTTSGYTYSWSPATGLSSSTISNPVLTYNNTSNDPDTMYYSVFVTNAFGCTALDSVRIIVRPVPVANAGANVTFCSGQSASLGTGSTSGYTYSWTPGGGLSSSTSSNPTVTLTNSGTSNVSFNYVVTATWFGCTDIDTVVVTVKPLPISNAGADVTLCDGDTLILGTGPTAGYSYAWSPAAGLSSTTVSNPTLIVSNPGPGADTLVFTVTTTLNGCTTNDNIQIIINELPNVQGTANPAAICVGGTATLTGTGASTYSWATVVNPGTSIGTGSSITVSPATTTSYIVTGASSVNCENRDTITVTVNPLPNVQASTPNDTICQGDSITITGSGASSYSWALLTAPGTVISTNNSIYVGPGSTTSYIVTGTDGNGCVNKDTVQIYVNPAPLANQILGTVSVCPGVTGVSYWITPATPGSTYIWSITGGNLASGQGNDSILVDWDSAGTAMVTVIELTNAGCESDTLQLPVNINVILTPVAPAGMDTICANQAIGMIYSTINTPQSTYTWHIQGGNIVSGNGSSTVTVDWTLTGLATGAIWYEELSVTVDTVCFGVSDTFYVTIKPSPATSPINGGPAVCVFDSTGLFSVTSTAGSGYSWNVTPGSILSGNGTSTITATWNASGTYTVYVIETNSYGCIGDTITASLLVNPLPVANAGADVAICTGDNTTLSASGGISYNWSPGTGLNNTAVSNPVASPVQTTSYVVQVTDTNGCRNTDTVTVTVNALPPANAGIDSAICLGSNAQLNATGGIIYTWTPATGLSNTAIGNPLASPGATTTYTVTVTDGNGCSKTDEITITVNSLPVAVASADSVICNGSAITLHASGGISYSWSPVTDLDNPVLQNPTASPSVPTTYTVTVTDNNGCTDTEEVQVDVDAQPVADFDFTDSVDCSGVTLYFKNNSQNATHYHWTLGTGGTWSNEFEPVHFYEFNRLNNYVTLIAINNNCSDTLVKPAFTFGIGKYLEEMSNVFTPNNDGINDCFNLEKAGKFKDCASFEIYNRWGKKMFESASGSDCWDGTNSSNGEACDEGVYFYLLKVRSAEAKGTVQLMR